MQTAAECIPCFVRLAAEAVMLIDESLVPREVILRRILHELADADWSGSPPEVSQMLHRIIREETASPDPYLALKGRMNQLALAALPACRELIATAADPQEAVVRIAVAGNLLDAGAKVQIQPEQLPGILASLWDQPLAGNPQELFRAAAAAKRILYLADNAGEIVFDRLLIEALPFHKVTVAVRGCPVLNDALREDAMLAGILDLVPVIDNGSDAPGTVLADCSETFLDHFYRADLIIAKGQGNYETLSQVAAPIFFLFTVKCPLVAAHIGFPTGTLVAKRTPVWENGGSFALLHQHRRS
jgi:uncharacterized protein with ATP-grasp and redox domains